MVREALIQLLFGSLLSTTDTHRTFLLVAFITSKERAKLLFPQASQIQTVAKTGQTEKNNELQMYA